MKSAIVKFGQIIRNRLIMQLSIKNPLQIPKFESLSINVLLQTTLFAPSQILSRDPILCRLLQQKIWAPATRQVSKEKKQGTESS
jgi:hypothetical protein